MAESIQENEAKAKGHSRTRHETRKTSRVYEIALASFNAAKYGNFDELQATLTPKAFKTKDEFIAVLNSKDKEGNTLILKCIHGAAARQVNPHSNFVKCLSFLLSIGIDVNSQDSVGRTALHWCILYGNLYLLDFLVQSGGSLLTHDGSGLSSLHLAIGIRSDRLRDEFVEYICAAAPNELLEALDGHDRSPLFLAFSVSALRTFENLLIGKANPNGIGPDGRQVIIHCIEKGQGKFTELLLRYGVSLSSKDPDGFTAIHLAACQENPESIYVLTEKVSKTLLNVKDHLGRTPLMYACLMGFDKNVELLIAQKIWTLDQDNEGKTALHHTINNTHTGCADLLCRASKKIVNMGDQEGHTVAHDAVITGNDKILNSLLENDCDITVKDNGGHTLIHWATAYGTLSCFDKLLEYDAPLNEIDGHGVTPLHYGCQKDADENLNNARSKVINILLLNGAKLDAVDNEGRKPIHWAASSGNTSAMEILLTAGDDVNSRTSREQMTALHLASFQGLTEVVDFLVKQKNIDINALDNPQCTPLFYACASGHTRAAEILLKCDADPNLNNEIGESPSHCAASFGAVECLELLFKSGAYLSHYNDVRDTPLHEAASSGKEHSVKFLLENGCQPSVKNATGATPLHYSVAEGFVNVTRCLLEMRADANALVIANETEYITPLDIALGNSDHTQIELLQTFGARTGRSIVVNSSLVIQHQWKVFTRRFSGVDSIYRLNVSDSISNHEETKTEKIEKENEHEDNDVISDEKEADTNATNQVLGHSLVDTCMMHTGKEEDDGEISEEEHSEDDFDSMKQLIMERIKSSRAEMERTDQLMERAENLKLQVEKVVKDVRDLGASKEFQIIKDYNERIARRRKIIQPICSLPKLPSR
eukprot:Seg2284.4 transcript_id=Seg2284.4/GoldUCD/mRNA.D3Y31 product=Inversin protein_id=Seg2284.4/GoldUCD/D3Y31